MALRTLIAVFSLFMAAVTATAAPPNSSEQHFQWQLLSSKNFPSQIHLHPHILLFVTVPWCGESRSLMREISLNVANEQEKYGSLKLMFVYSNFDKVLADSLGVMDEITVLCYNHGESYKYQGSLRVPDILSSVHYLISLVPEELPLRKINNSEDMGLFLASTDKAVLLLDTCGWTSKLLAQNVANETAQGGFLLRDLDKRANRTQPSGRKKYLKDGGIEMMNCEVDDECGSRPWVGEFSAGNETDSSTNEDPTDTSCSFKEYKIFESFFSKFIAAARDAYLPPRRQSYALVSDMSLLSPLGVEVSDPWSLIISHTGCPGCLIKLKEETYLQDALVVHDFLPVIELLEEKGLGPSLPIDEPSMLLFVDRASDSVETFNKSQEALRVFKELALQHGKLHRNDWRSSEWPRKSDSTKGSGATYSSSLMLSSVSHKVKDKMSIVIIKDGKPVTLDTEASEFHSSSLQEILANLLAQKKHSKLSSLANEAGFQLLSDDINIKISDTLPSQLGSLNHDSTEKLDAAADTSVIDVDKGNAGRVPLLGEGGEQLQPAKIETQSVGNKQKLSTATGSRFPASMDPHQSDIGLEVVSSILVDSKSPASDEAAESEAQGHHRNDFAGSFYFCDGNYKFLRSLTNDLKVPSIVIVDPIAQQHYIFSGEATENLSSVSTFIDQFVNGSLLPYKRSGPLQKPLGMPHPPLVNLDFQEKDSIPSVTTDTFSELVIGSGQAGAENVTNAWHKDVVVLFSTNWCGFCQRMKLVVREVFRALKGYMSMVDCDSESKGLCSKDDFKDLILKMPTVYSIDCTINDCGWILKSTGQREVYPSLLLFPAEKKTVIPYNGNMVVSDIMKFIANHGISSEHLAREKGTVWTEGEERDYHDGISGDVFSKGFPNENDEHVRGFNEDIKLQNQVTPELTEESTSWDLVAGSLLIATDRLNGLNPFSEARILVVIANPGIGFQGLIVNKRISWNQGFGFENAEHLREAPFSFGGPVIQEGRPLVSLTRNPGNHQYPQVMPGVYFLDQLATIHIIEEIKAGNQSATEFWFFWGYAGWDSDQLYAEITEGSWQPLEGSIEDLQWP